MPTLKEVAEAAGVSTVTASSVLSGAGRVRVSTATAQRIRDMARSMNYVPRAAARGLRTGKVQAIGFVTSATAQTRWEAHWQEVLRGVSDVLWDREERLILSLPKSEEHELEVLRQLAFGHQVDGLIIQNCMPGDSRVEMLQEAAVPFVTLGGEVEASCHTIVFDTNAFSEILTKHVLTQAGAMAVFAAKPQTRESREFLHGCRRTARVLGQPCEEWTGAFVPDSEALQNARARAGAKPLGIVLVRQLLPELLQALGAAALELETDVVVTYIAGVEEITLTPPGIEIVPLDYYSLGRRAAKILFQLIDEKDNAPAPARNLVLPGMAEHLLQDQREP